ncbi:acyltransferase [Alteriqipengyuania sp. NZ-12B]|uniref:Acyltransferase n=1 Tax=Alteriqipengyuania abyssalis TaxID=2860200 RepID=A0ABS7PFQ0_9SPHN|nr:acyltransferase [Alteriqipengyuania abyssalis]MBY8336637.1 acyltransferase [Alteriqipengyuania abyssalis]
MSLATPATAAAQGVADSGGAPPAARRKLTPNNFDLIRLFAASEVALKHMLLHLELGEKWLDRISILPGVPIFFFVSGLLIFQSYRNSGTVATFSMNRIYRLFPGLILCLIVGIVLAIALGALTMDEIASPGFAIWVFAQSTIGQFYNPEFLRDFGVGVLNGSLWTISVEIQFYIATPIIALLVLRWPIFWVLGLATSIGFNVLLGALPPDASTAKLLMVTCLPWIYMFIGGAWLSTRHDILDRLIALSWWKVLAIFGGTIGLSWLLGLPFRGNDIGPIAFVGVVFVIVKAAYSRPTLSDSLLNRNDLSYGIYIYHMLFVNAAVELGFIGTGWSLIAVILATVGAAAFSWFFVEKKALAMKKKSIRRVDPREPKAHW